MGYESEEYLPLVSNPPTLEQRLEHHSTKPDRSTASRERYLLVVILLQAVVIVAAMFFIVTRVRPDSDRPSLYSPAQVALENKIVTFTEGLEAKTIYQEISDDAERAWGQLYNHTIMKIPKSEAVLLPNKTYPIKDDPGYYIIDLDVFHQLHCLHKIRHALYKEHYPDDHDLDDVHISHCVDSIRQYIMCNADVSAIVWQWNAKASVAEPRFSQAHICRDFDKLLDWTREHRMHHYINPKLFVEDDLPTPPVIY